MIKIPGQDPNFTLNIMGEQLKQVRRQGESLQINYRLTLFLRLNSSSLPTQKQQPERLNFLSFLPNRRSHFKTTKAPDILPSHSRIECTIQTHVDSTFSLHGNKNLPLKFDRKYSLKSRRIALP